MPEAVQDRTNNFITCFDSGVEKKLREPTPPQLCIAYLERRGGLWTRFREQYADLFFEIGTLQQRKMKQTGPDFLKYVDLLAEGKQQEAFEFRDRVRLSERTEIFDNRLAPMLNCAFDLLVSWGAKPEKLRM